MTVVVANSPTRTLSQGGQERFFVKAGSRWPFSLSAAPAARGRYLPFPFSLAYLAALLEREELPVEVFDGVALGVDRETFLQRCASFSPKIVFLEVTTPTIADDLQVCVELKRRTGAQIVVGGPHASHFATSLLRDEACLDAVVCGEYELSALALCRALLGGDEAAVARVPGVVSRDASGAVVSGPRAEPIRELDRLPFPARHLFPTRYAPSVWPYWDGFCQRRPAVQMHASRGCPFKCTFCLWVSVMYEQGPYRTFSATRIVDEMKHVIREHGAREIYFDDDIFTAREKHVLALCEEIEARGIRIPWSVMGDAIAVTDRGLRAMARAGCVGMKFGIESANEEVLRRLRKPLKLDRVREVVGLCAELGMKTHATITFGLEGDTPQTMQETLDFCCALPVDSIQFSVTTPYPGTEHHANARREGRLVGGFDAYDGARCTVLRFDAMSGEYVARFASRAPSVWLRARLRDPQWVRRQLGYLGGIARDQGWRGVLQRGRRATELLFDLPR